MASTLPATKPLKLVQGQAKKFLLNFKNKDGTPFDLTGKTIVIHVKDATCDEDILILKSSADSTQIEILLPATNGQARLKFVPTDTNELHPGDYLFDIWIDQGAGDELPVTSISTLTIAPRITVLT